MTIHNYKIYALTAKLSQLYSSEQEERMNQNRRETDSDFAVLFDTPRTIIPGQTKFPHTREHRLFTHLLTAYAYIKEHDIVNPILTHTHYNPNEWRLEWNIEEQS